MSYRAKPAERDIVYVYDGSFDGLMCCVFESYAENEMPIDIISQEKKDGCIFEKKYISTDLSRCERVISSIPKKMGEHAYLFIKKAFLTCLCQKEMYILKFMRLGYAYGGDAAYMLAHDTVAALNKAVVHLTKESHLYKGFVRFCETDGILTARIEPKNIVIPLIADHFCRRFPEERFIIYDATNKMALAYKPYSAEIIYTDDFDDIMSASEFHHKLHCANGGKSEVCDIMSASEFHHKLHCANGGKSAAVNKTDEYARLWKAFYDSIAINERRNEKCRMSHMPKRYWKNMTEMTEL
ncbi:MAG: TIGR03915 family putative DNA repair protein [Eubacteriales bacterium]|nr:TIGR03915 family putative DNA repair protein [Eubacteriales bacterium]